MGMMDLVNALRKSKSYLGGISVTNIFPKDPKQFNPESLAKFQKMTDDSNFTLKFGAFGDKGKREILKKYNTFKKYFKSECKYLKKVWIATEKFEKDVQNSKKAFEDCEETLKKHGGLLKTQKKDLSDYGKNKFILKKLAEEKEGLNKKLITEQEKIDSLIKECREYVDKETIKIKASAKKILDDYANHRGLKGEDLARWRKGEYVWGATMRKDALEARKAYKCFYEIEGWKEDYFKDEFNLFAAPPQFTGKYKNKGDALNAIKKQLSNLETKINKLSKTKLDSDEAKKHIDSLVGDGGISTYTEYVNCQEEYFKYMTNYSNSLEELKKNALKVISCCEKVKEAIKVKLIDTLYLEEKESEDFQSAQKGKESSKGSFLTLVQVLGSIWYYMDELSQRYSKCIKSVNDQQSDITEKRTAFNEKKLKAYGSVQNISRS